MVKYPDSYHALTRFPTWDELDVRVGLGAAFDYLWIEQYTDALQATPVASHWIRDMLEDA